MFCEGAQWIAGVARFPEFVLYIIIKERQNEINKSMISAHIEKYIKRTEFLIERQKLE